MFNIDFLKYRKLCGLFSLLMIASFVGLVLYRQTTRGYAFNYSVDFVGGTQVLFKFQKPVSDTHIREILEKKGWTNPTLRDFSETEVLVRVKEYSDDVKGLAESMRSSLQDALPDQNTVTILSTDSVGSAVGSATWIKSFRAIALGLIAMLLYIWFRFWSISYGMGAVIALFHDAIAILFVFLLFDKEISINVIAAILAILGYSINDTIVIFNRIRDNIKTMPNTPIAQVVNLSINQTLRRTLLTSFSTALVVISLFVLGGEALRDLSLALLVGIVFGTYSSIYIASPIMLLLNKEAK